MADIAKNPDNIHAPGIYFGMSEQDYHSDPALGSTDIRLLASKPWLWQYRRLRPKSQRTTPEMIWGSAFHCRVLEGAEEFAERYRRAPAPDDYPGCLVTVDDLKKALAAREQKVSGLKKSELIAALKCFLDAPVIFDDVLEVFAKRPRVKVSDDISPDIVLEVNDAVANMERDPVLSAVMKAGSLIHGSPELSIFYMANGYRRKARFDYPIPPTANRPKSLIVDLKSFASFKGFDPEDSAKRKIYDDGYDVQAVDYSIAFGHGLQLVEEDKVFGKEPYEDFARDLFGAPLDFVWVMLKRDEGMLPITLSIDLEDLHFKNVRTSIEAAYANLDHFIKEFGPGALWTPPPRLPIRLTYQDFPSYQRGY